MVSGYGAKGGRGRCYTLWQDFISCTTKHGTYGIGVCQNERDDYMECLHHKKLASRLQAIKQQKEKLIQEGKWPPNK